MTETTIPAPVRHAPLWQIRLRLAWKSFLGNWALFRENPIGLVGIGLIVFFGLMAALHPILMKTVWDTRVYDPIIGYDTTIIVHPSPPRWLANPNNPLQEWSLRHLLGTDPLGRDVLSQLMYSTQSEFALGIMAAVVTVFIATTTGRGLRLLRRRDRHAVHAPGRPDDDAALHRHPDRLQHVV